MSDVTSSEEFEARFPEVAAAIQAVILDAQSAILKTSTNQKDEREQLYYAMKAAEAVRHKLVRHIDARQIERRTQEHAVTAIKPTA